MCRSKGCKHKQCKVYLTIYDVNKSLLGGIEMTKNLYKQKREEGFTIIEVLIVLAIAGLIILIVFLAVPALQRNSRNTQRKNDVSAIAGALNEYISNNQGKLPIDDGSFETNVRTNANVGFYDDTSSDSFVYNKSTSAQEPDGPAGADLDTVHIETFSKCDGNASTLTGATSRSVIALYRVETGSGDTSQCQEL